MTDRAGGSALGRRSCNPAGTRSYRTAPNWVATVVARPAVGGVGRLESDRGRRACACRG